MSLPMWSVWLIGIACWWTGYYAGKRVERIQARRYRDNLIAEQYSHEATSMPWMN